jgi:hypothetical protein
MAQAQASQRAVGGCVIMIAIEFVEVTVLRRGGDEQSVLS